MSEETMKVKVHKVTLAVVDHDELGPESVVTTLENARYPNRCMSPHGMSIETKEVDWHDQHPLNIIHKQAEAFRELFLDDNDEGLRRDAERFRWLLNGNGYFMEESSLCGHPPCSDKEKAEARREIDEAMSDGGEQTIGEQTGESCSGCGRANTWHPDCPICEKLTELEELKAWQKRIVAIVSAHHKVKYWGKETADIIEEWSKKMKVFDNLTQAARNVLLEVGESAPRPAQVPFHCSYCGTKIDPMKDAHFTQGDLTYCRKCIDEVGI